MIVILVWVPYLATQGINMRPFTELLAVFALVILCGEVPSGLLLDTRGRKKTLLLGSVTDPSSVPSSAHILDARTCSAWWPRVRNFVEVLPKEAFDEQHLPGAIHLPLRKIDAGVRSSLDPARPVVLYCWDSA
jgi:hypothetical protein